MNPFFSRNINRVHVEVESCWIQVCIAQEPGRSESHQAHTKLRRLTRKSLEDEGVDASDTARIVPSGFRNSWHRSHAEAKNRCLPDFYQQNHGRISGQVLTYLQWERRGAAAGGLSCTYSDVTPTWAIFVFPFQDLKPAKQYIQCKQVSTFPEIAICIHLLT